MIHMQNRKLLVVHHVCHVKVIKSQFGKRNKIFNLLRSSKNKSLRLPFLFLCKAKTLTERKSKIKVKTHSNAGQLNANIVNLYLWNAKICCLNFVNRKKGNAKKNVATTTAITNCKFVVRKVEIIFQQWDVFLTKIKLLKMCDLFTIVSILIAMLFNRIS